MNALGWTLTHSEEFAAKIDAFLNDIETRLQASPPEEEAERLLKESDALKPFVSAANRIQRGETDPIELPAACEADGTPIPNFYVLKVGPWRGYYRLDHVAKVGVGVLALHQNHKLTTMLKGALEDASKKP